MARSCRADAAPLARARRGRVLRHLLLRVGHALLPGRAPVGPRRPHADAARAGAVRVLARVGARAAAPGARSCRSAASRSAACSGSRRSPSASGERFERDGAAVVPLPHPSGASGWLNAPANRERVAQAVDLIHAELAAQRHAIAIMAPALRRQRLALLVVEVDRRRSRLRAASRAARRATNMRTEKLKRRTRPSRTTYALRRRSPGHRVERRGGRSRGRRPAPGRSTAASAAGCRRGCCSRSAADRRGAALDAPPAARAGCRRRRSTRRTVNQLTTRSKRPSHGSSRMSPSTYSTSTPRAAASARARSRKSGVASSPVTRAPRAARRFAIRPCPHARSSTSMPGSSSSSRQIELGLAIARLVPDPLRVEVEVVLVEDLVPVHRPSLRQPGSAWLRSVDGRPRAELRDVRAAARLPAARTSGRCSSRSCSPSGRRRRRSRWRSCSATPSST